MPRSHIRRRHEARRNWTASVRRCRSRVSSCSWPPRARLCQAAASTPSGIRGRPLEPLPDGAVERTVRPVAPRTERDVVIRHADPVSVSSRDGEPSHLRPSTAVLRSRARAVAGSVDPTRPARATPRCSWPAQTAVRWSCSAARRAAGRRSRDAARAARAALLEVDRASGQAGRRADRIALPTGGEPAPGTSPSEASGPFTDRDAFPTWAHPARDRNRSPRGRRLRFATSDLELESGARIDLAGDRARPGAPFEAGIRGAEDVLIRGRGSARAGGDVGAPSRIDERRRRLRAEAAGESGDPAAAGSRPAASASAGTVLLSSAGADRGELAPRAPSGASSPARSEAELPCPGGPAIPTPVPCEGRERPARLLRIADGSLSEDCSRTRPPAPDLLHAPICAIEPPVRPDPAPTLHSPRLQNDEPTPNPDHRRRRLPRQPPLRALPRQEGYEVICMDNLITGDLRNVEHLFGRGGLPLFAAPGRDRVHPRSGELDVRSCTSPRRRARSTTSSCRSRPSRSARSGRTRRSGSPRPRARASARLDLRVLRRPPRFHPQKEDLLGQRQPGRARAASTTRPSASPRR